MARSTAKFISYDLRPSKQSERRILIDVLKSAGDIGLPIQKYRYVGMGANRFYDFSLIHKYIGIRNMISLEHDPVMHKRALFNVPYSFIEVLNKDCNEFIAQDESADPSVYWFDYDGAIRGDIIREIIALGAKLRVGDFLFVTVYGGVPRLLENMNTTDRLAWLEDNLGHLGAGILREDVETSAFSNTVYKLVSSAFRNAVSTRKDGKFYDAVRMEYNDSTPMITFGGGFLSSGQIVSLKEKIAENMPFLNLEDKGRYVLNNLHITERERQLFDRAATHKQRRNKERNTLINLGFKDGDIDSYKDLVRFLPRYVETII